MPSPTLVPDALPAWYRKHHFGNGEVMHDAYMGCHGVPYDTVPCDIMCCCLLLCVAVAVPSYHVLS